jgi:hypothetical protein
MSVKGACAIVGLGMTPMGKVYGRSATDFAIEAVELALHDAGLERNDVDGLLINANMSREMSLPLQNALQRCSERLSLDIWIRQPRDIFPWLNPSAHRCRMGKSRVGQCDERLWFDGGHHDSIRKVSFATLLAGTGWSFVEVARRHGDFALVGVATTVALDTSGNCSTTRDKQVHSAGYLPLAQILRVRGREPMQ